MPVKSLDHVNIRTVRMEETIIFFTEVLGFQVLRRPQASYPSAFILDGDDHAVLHLTGIDLRDPETRARFTADLGPRESDAIAGSGVVDHVAFGAVDCEAMMRTLRQRDIAFHERNHVPSGLRQLFIPDPNGVVVELNFHGEAVLPGPGK